MTDYVSNLTSWLIVLTGHKSRGVGRGIMTHQNLGVATRLLLELSLLVLLEAAGGGGEKSARDARCHYDGGLLRLWVVGEWATS